MKKLKFGGMVLVLTVLTTGLWAAPREPLALVP